MGWAEDGLMTSGKWADWTQVWSTGQDLWDATNMTKHNSRYTKVGGTIYAQGGFKLAAGTNYGNGDGVWVLWWPGEFGTYVDASTGNRIVGDGIVYSNASPWRSFSFGIRVVNTFSVFGWTHTVRNYGGTQYFNGGADTAGVMDRAALSWIGAPLTCTFKLRFMTDPTL